MAINVFEGARRISYLVMGLWCVGVAIYLISDTPSVEVSYVVRGPAQPFTRTAQPDCASVDRSDWRYYTTEKRTSVRVDFCFKAYSFKDGKMLVPYRIDDKGGIWGHDWSSNEVREYVKRRLDEFAIPNADQNWADDQYWPARFRQMKSVLLIWLVGGLVTIWIVSFLIGWIARGFAGIPMGRDRKPVPPSNTQDA